MKYQKPKLSANFFNRKFLPLNVLGGFYELNTSNKLFRIFFNIFLESSKP